jgi:hypothetical protein
MTTLPITVCALLAAFSACFCFFNSAPVSFGGSIVGDGAFDNMVDGSGGGAESEAGMLEDFRGGDVVLNIYLFDLLDDSFTIGKAVVPRQDLRGVAFNIYRDLSHASGESALSCLY